MIQNYLLILENNNKLVEAIFNKVESVIFPKIYFAIDVILKTVTKFCEELILGIHYFLKFSAKYLARDHCFQDRD